MTVVGDHVGLLRRYVRQYYDGLTDDELHWEPVPGMWGVRRQESGEITFDGLEQRDAPAPPLTMIAWRMGHVISMARSSTDDLAGVERRPMPAMPLDAAGTLEVWWGAMDGFVHAVRALSEEELTSPLGAVDENVTRAGWISHNALEIAFHSAEVGTMRHLYREMHAPRRT